MHKLGISIYPEHSTEEKDFAYMELAAKYGFKRIFTCLLSVTETKEEIMKNFTRFMDKAHELGFEVSVDTNPTVFKHLGATPFDISPFAQMHVDIIRLDGHFGDYEDIAITRNKQGIKIEFNASAKTGMDLLLERGADQHNVIMCHNFYPQRYTALGWETFMEFNRRWKALGLHNAAFVSSNNEHTFGPWPVYAGLPTCEIHRGKPIDLQLRHLLATNMIDDVLIGNAFATEAELKAMADVDVSKITMRMDVDEQTSEEERNIIFNYTHMGRGDAPDFMLRSSMTRFIYRKKEIAPRIYDKPMFHRGDVVVVNDNLAHYRGELQVILKDMPNDGERNYVGRIPEDEQMILDLIKPEFAFGFIQ